MKDPSAAKLHSIIQLNKQLETIFSSSSDGLWVCDREGRVLTINKASEQLKEQRDPPPAIPVCHSKRDCGSCNSRSWQKPFARKKPRARLPNL
jgi:hypothetical protein